MEEKQQNNQKNILPNEKVCENCRWFIKQIIKGVFDGNCISLKAHLSMYDSSDFKIFPEKIYVPASFSCINFESNIMRCQNCIYSEHNPDYGDKWYCKYIEMDINPNSNSCKFYKYRG